MKSTAQKLLLISFIVAIIAAAAIFLYLKSLNSPKKDEVKEASILVAAQNIPARTQIKKNMVKKISVPYNAIFEEYINDSSKILGKYSKETILKNEGFKSSNLLGSDGDGLSFKIDNDFRAISVNVTGDSGVSDLLKPGDHVDVITYFAEKKDGDKVIRPDEARIILQNIKLLAIDRQLAREEVEGKDKTAVDNQKITNFLVTLCVPKSDVEKLVLAESVGIIKLALRPLKDTDTASDTIGTTIEELYNTGNEKNNTGNEKTNSTNNSSTIPASSPAPAPTNTAKSNTTKYKTYQVKPGDTLKRISLKYYGTKSKYTLLKKANNITNENLIATGQIIKIPIMQ